MERKKHLCFDCKNAYAGKCKWFNIKNGGTKNAIPQGCEFCSNKNGYKIYECPNFILDKPLTNSQIAKLNNISYASDIHKLAQIRKTFTKKVDR